MTARYHMVGIGEALLDVIGDQQHLGGAPLNLAVHAHRLPTYHSAQSAIVSRIGQDAAGQLLTEQLRQAGLGSEYLQLDPDRPTGRAIATIDAQGEPHFEIPPDAAWDRLQFDPELEDLAQNCDGAAFGTLAQRNAQTRNTIYRFLGECRLAVRLLDVNLRNDFDDARLLRRSCAMASIVKANGRELANMAGMLGIEQAAATGDQRQIEALAVALREQFELDMVVVTRGAAGTIAFTGDGRHEADPAHYPPAEHADAIGAGDACGAAILVGRVLRLPVTRMLELANHTGAYVASQPGATPPLPEPIIQMVGNPSV